MWFSSVNVILFHDDISHISLAVYDEFHRSDLHDIDHDTAIACISLFSTGNFVDQDVLL
jgi:hypothetical protein